MELNRPDIVKNDLNYLHVAGGWGGQGQLIIKAKPISTTKTTTEKTTTSTSTTSITTSTSSPGKLTRLKPIRD